MKPKREITLGEMQDECKRVFGGCALCRVKNECAFCLDVQPAEVDLTDPPRFTEAQMALLKALSAIGVERIETLDMAAFRMMDKNERHVSLIRAIGLKENETLDLAELFGKEGTK